MTEIELTDSSLVVKIGGVDRLLSFRKLIEVPWGHVLGAVVGVTPEVSRQLHRSMRTPGAYVPGVVTAGSYYHLREKSWLFFNIRHGKKAITINLANEHFKALVVEVVDPEGMVAAINAVVEKVQGVTDSSLRSE